MALTITTDRVLFRQTLIAWLNTYAGLGGRVIWADQTAVRPAKPYGTVFFPSGGVKTGIDDEVQSFYAPGSVVQRRTSGPRLITLQVEVYTDPATTAHANEAAELLENALLALDTVAVRDSFRAAKIGVISQTPVVRLDDQLGERWERRAMSEVVLSYSGETFDDGGSGTGNWIETVQTPTEQNGNADYES
jgi:hypothetical protein